MNLTDALATHEGPGPLIIQCPADLLDGIQIIEGGQ